ncbi:hypothetical protein A5848_000980 [Enterococcus faecium]|nr:hypothetical protein A5848_000980 [Enterococcus faecium]
MEIDKTCLSNSYKSMNSYTHLDVYKRQVICYFHYVKNNRRCVDGD